MTPTFAARIVLGALLQPAFCALVLFYPPGDFAWGRAWTLVGVCAGASVASMALLLRTSPALLAERLRPPIQRGQPRADRVVVLALLAAFAGALRFIPYDVFVLRLLPPPPRFVAAGGLVLFVAGWAIAVAALGVNAFAALVVKSQAARGQHVVATGPYAVVRHPMYAGVVLIQIGVPLWLESTAGVLAALVPIAVLAARIRTEEAFLRRELAGYADYAARVRARLIPGIW